MNIRGMSLLVGLLVAVPATVSEAHTAANSGFVSASSTGQLPSIETETFINSSPRVATRDQVTEFSKLLDAGDEHNCVIDEGDVYCWGANFYGQLGLGDTEFRGDDPGEMGDSLEAVNLGAGLSAVSISAGHAHTCALLDNGKVIHSTRTHDCRVSRTQESPCG